MAVDLSRARDELEGNLTETFQTILKVLGEKSLTAQELADERDIGTQAARRHLRYLDEQGIITREESDGQAIQYQVNEKYLGAVSESNAAIVGNDRTTETDYSGESTFY